MGNKKNIDAKNMDLMEISVQKFLTKWPTKQTLQLKIFSDKMSTQILVMIIYDEDDVIDCGVWIDGSW